MRTKRSKRWDTGVKARLLAQLMYYDQDFKFEYACLGLTEMLARYTQRELKTRLIPYTQTCITPIRKIQAQQKMQNDMYRQMLAQMAIPKEML